MKFKKTKIAFSVLCGVMCLLLIAAWVRSYSWIDGMNAYRATSTHELISPEWGCFNSSGVIGLCYFPDSTSFAIREWEFLSVCNEKSKIPPPESSFLKFYIELSPNQRRLFIPHWFLAPAMAALAMLPWLDQLGWRYSLRTLLIATTAIAVALWFIVWMSRK